MAIDLLKSIVSRFIAGTEGTGTADIIFSSDNGKNNIVLPYVPADLPEFQTPQNNSTFSAIGADLSVIGTLGLRQTSFEFFAPVKPNKYSFCRPYGSGALKILAFFDSVQLEKIPCRICIVYSNGATYMNMACLINNFNYFIDNVGDYHFSMNLIEYRMPNKTGGVTSI